MTQENRLPSVSPTVNSQLQHNLTQSLQMGGYREPQTERTTGGSAVEDGNSNIPMGSYGLGAMMNGNSGPTHRQPIHHNPEKPIPPVGNQAFGKSNNPPASSFLPSVLELTNQLNSMSVPLKLVQGEMITSINLPLNVKTISNRNTKSHLQKQAQSHPQILIQGYPQIPSTISQNQTILVNNGGNLNKIEYPGFSSVVQPLESENHSKNFQQVKEPVITQTPQTEISKPTPITIPPSSTLDNKQPKNFQNPSPSIVQQPFKVSNIGVPTLSYIPSGMMHGQTNQQQNPFHQPSKGSQMASILQTSDAGNVSGPTLGISTVSSFPSINSTIPSFMKDSNLQGPAFRPQPSPSHAPLAPSNLDNPSK